MRILLAEDDLLLGKAIEQALKDSAHSVDRVLDGPTALVALKEPVYSLLLLDLGLPGKDGLAVLRSIRNDANPVPVIIITARDAIEDRIEGLDIGADDYIIKPFSIDELEARMRAVIRRRNGSANPRLESRDIVLDPISRQAASKGSTHELSAREYAILHALMSRPGAILSRDELEDRIYGWNEEVASNAVEFSIHGLRRKLGKSAIRNVRGLGWMVEK